MVRNNMQEIVERTVKQYMAAHEIVMDEIERATGKRPEPYKDLELDVLSKCFEKHMRNDRDGFQFIADLLSALIVDQALPNANHRTAMFFVASLLRQQDLQMDLVRNAKNIREYFLDSKHLMRKGKRDFREKHRELTRGCLQKILGSAQSGRLGSISANSFIVSFSASSKDI